MKTTKTECNRISGRSCTPGGRSWDLLRLQQNPCRAVELHTQVYKTLVVCLSPPQSRRVGIPRRVVASPAATRRSSNADANTSGRVELTEVCRRRRSVTLNILRVYVLILFLSRSLPLILHCCLVFLFFLLLPYVVYLLFHLIYPSGLASVVDPTLVPCHHCALNFVWLRMRWLMRRSDPLLHHSWSFGVFVDGAFFCQQCWETVISTSEFLKKFFSFLFLKKRIFKNILLDKYIFN